MSQKHKIFLSVLDVLQKNNIDFLLIGGLAVNYHGFTRDTMVIDFMMALPDVHVLVNIMREAGFTSYDIQPMVVFFKRPDHPVRIDFLRIDSTTLEKLNRSAVKINIGNYQVKIPSVNDLLAMKLHSFHQSNMCRDKDMTDIVALCVIHNISADTVLHPLAQKFASETIYQQICDKIHAQNRREDNVRFM